MFKARSVVWWQWKKVVRRFCQMTINLHDLWMMIVLFFLRFKGEWNDYFVTVAENWAINDVKHGLAAIYITDNFAWYFFLWNLKLCLQLIAVRLDFAKLNVITFTFDLMEYRANTYSFAWWPIQLFSTPGGGRYIFVFILCRRFLNGASALSFRSVFFLLLFYFTLRQEFL